MNTLLKVKINKKWNETRDICVLELVRSDGGDLPSFHAGAHIDLHLDHNLVRQYSICSSPINTKIYQIAVLRESSSRGGSVIIHDKLQTGDVIQISEPRNFFSLDMTASHHVLFAGGIGITPIIAMAEELHYYKASFSLHYVTRDKSQTVFFKRLEKSPFSSMVHIYHSNEQSKPKLNIAQIIEMAPDDAHLYVCGPERFMNAVITESLHHGWLENRIHRESFQASTADSFFSSEFTLVLAKSGREIPVLPHQSPLRALLNAGIDIPYSCEQGICGTCLTKVLNGDVDHRDHYLTEEERKKNDQFLPCCSRSFSKKLVIDL